MRERRTTGDTAGELTYHVHNGNYDVPIVDVSDTEVPTTEMFLRQHIGTLLQQGEHPVVCMDVGSGASITALRLAAEHEQAIIESRLAVVTTNLAMNVEGFINEIAAPSRRERTAALYAAQKDNIHELTTDFTPGQELGVTLPDSTTLDLTGNVDIAHEHLSLTAWAQDPRNQIPALGKLVSSRGIYMVPKRDIQTRKEHAVKDGIDPLAYDQAHTELQDTYGHTVVHAVEQGEYAGISLTYKIFRGPQAPPISL